MLRRGGPNSGTYAGVMHSPPKAPIRLAFRALIFCVALVVAWLVACLILFAAPAVDQPEHADAVVVLAPPLPTGRLAYAESLMAEGYADTLVISVPKDSTGVAPTHLCEEDHPYEIVCFTPDPITTRGEARALQPLAEEKGWQTINVVTNDFHVTRARIILKRCYAGDLNMLAARQDTSLVVWAYRFAYETAAFAKVAADNEC